MRGKSFADAIEDALAQANHRFVLAGRDEAHDMEMGGEKVYMGTGGAAVKVIDLDMRRSLATCRSWIASRRGTSSLT